MVMTARRLSLRRQLLLGILLPVLGFVAVNAVSQYRQALRAADTAYDRTLLASAKSIGELLERGGPTATPQLQAHGAVRRARAFEADNRSRMFYKVSGFAGEMVSGFEDLPAWHGRIPDRGIYAALVDFYDDHYRGEPVRVAVLLQPVAGPAGQGMATIQVAETLELRRHAGAPGADRHAVAPGRAGGADRARRRGRRAARDAAGARAERQHAHAQRQRPVADRRRAARRASCCRWSTRPTT